jgi:hypothetical protein
MERREFLTSQGVCYHATWDYLKQEENSENEDESEEEKDPELIVTFYKDKIEIGKLTKNGYRTITDKFMLLEWFETNDNVVFLFNVEHGQIGIFDANTCLQLSETSYNDVFITDYKMFDKNEYLYISGWIWNPLAVRCIYHIPTLLKNPEIDPIHIRCDDTKSRCNPGVTLMGYETCKEFLEKHDAIFEKIAKQKLTVKFNLNRTNDSILNRIVKDSSISESEQKAISLLKDIMSSDRLEYSESAIQNGNDKPSTHLHNLYETISNYYCTDKSNVNQVLLNSVFYCRLGYSYETFDTRFEIKTEIGNVVINMKHEMLVYEVAEHMKHCTGGFQVNLDGKLHISCKILE